MLEPQLPRFCWVPEHASSGGAEAVQLAADAGLFLDPWQAWAVEQILIEDQVGAPAAFEAGLVVPRQNGKGSCLEALALAWLFLEEVDLVLWSAHEFKTAAEAFRRMRMLLQGSQTLWPLVERITTANGDEAIELVTGQRLKFIARSKSSGVGFSGDKIILDEAWDLDGDQIAALIPTLATRPAAQIVYTSSAGRSTSDVLRAVRDRGRAGGDPALVWLEYCASPAQVEDGVEIYDHEDRQQWAAANPGLPVGRITEAFVEKERRSFLSRPARWARERLGVWDEPLLDLQPITPAAWKAGHVELPETVREQLGPPVFFLDVSPDSKSAAVAVAAMLGSTPHVELAAGAEGTAWLWDRVKEIRARHPKAIWAADSLSPAAALLPKLVRLGATVETFGAQDMAQACQHLQQMSANNTWTHAADPLLELAFADAISRLIGDAGWAWARRKSTGDICRLVAVTGAAWLLEKHQGGTKAPAAAQVPKQPVDPSNLWRPSSRLTL